MTKDQAQALVDSARTALQKALDNPEEYAISSTSGGRSVKRPSVATLTQALADAEARLARITRGGIRVRGGVPNQ
jgi:multidrug resistance efflux pump